MPRKAPNQVIEHRITFGDLERREFKQTLDLHQKQQRINNIVDGSKAVLYTGGAGVIAWLGYQTWLIVNPNEEKNPTGSNLWDTFIFRMGGMTKDEYVEKIVERNSDEDGNIKGGFWKPIKDFGKWFIGGSDEKFFFWDLNDDD